MTMNEPVSSRKGISMMLLSVIFFSANCLLIRWVGLFAEVDGWVTSFARGLAGTAFVLTLYSGGRGLHLSHLRKPLLLARGVVGMITISLLYFTIIHLGAARALVINLTYPLFGVLIASFFLKEKLQTRSLLLLLLALGGLGLFFFESLVGASFGRYDLIGLSGAALSGLAVVLIRKLTQTETAATIYSGQCLVTLVATVPLAWPSFATTSLAAWTVMLVGGVLVAWGQILITKGFYHLDVARGSTLQMLIPLLTGVGAFFFFEERFTPMEIIGAVLTLFATWRISTATTPSTKDPSLVGAPLKK